MISPARSFGTAADAYDRGRPAYPLEAVEWLVGSAPASVLELGAGTGKLTQTLVELGHDVFATDPDEKMLDVLSAKLPETRATIGTAEQVPAPDGSFDVVIAGQAFHWFDHPAALAEISRVLKPGGHLALLWNDRDARIPWVRRLGAIMGTTRPDAFPECQEIIAASGLFSATESETFKNWQSINRETVQDLVLNRSHTLALPEAEREALRTEVLAFYDDYGRGMDGMQLPYVTTCYRAVALPRPVSTLLSSGRATHPEPEHRAALPTAMHETADKLPRIATEAPDDTGIILIDFS